MGFASGGIMATVLACGAADRIAAVAVVSGMTSFEGCDPSRPVPMLGVHGTGDPVLLFNGGIGDASYLQGGTQKAYLAPAGQDDLDGEGMPEVARAWAGLQGVRRGGDHGRAPRRRRHRAHLRLSRGRGR